MGKFVDLTGKRFGRLTVRGISGRGNNKQILWHCDCECGKMTIAPTYHLNSGHTQSCGCYREEKATETGAIFRKHGKRDTRLYRIWRGMKQRCMDPGYHGFAIYGGRGITVCQEWRDSFQAFYDWAMANGYQDNLSIDRKDSNGPYSPENCRWATAIAQQNNKRNNRVLTYKGESRTAPEWARITGIQVTTIYNRMKYEWPIERILTEQPRNYTRRSK